MDLRLSDDRKINVSLKLACSRCAMHLKDLQGVLGGSLVLGPLRQRRAYMNRSGMKSDW